MRGGAFFFVVSVEMVGLWNLVSPLVLGMWLKPGYRGRGRGRGWGRLNRLVVSDSIIAFYWGKRNAIHPPYFCERDHDKRDLTDTRPEKLVKQKKKKKKKAASIFYTCDHGFGHLLVYCAHANEKKRGHGDHAFIIPRLRGTAKYRREGGMCM